MGLLSGLGDFCTLSTWEGASCLEALLKHLLTKWYRHTLPASYISAHSSLVTIMNMHLSVCQSKLQKYYRKVYIGPVKSYIAFEILRVWFRTTSEKAHTAIKKFLQVDFLSFFFFNG